MGKHEIQHSFEQSDISVSKRRTVLSNKTLVVFLKSSLAGEIASLTSTVQTKEFNEDRKSQSPAELFVLLKDVNRLFVKGIRLYESLNELRLCGWISPSTLLLTGPSEDLKVVKHSWIKRSLKSPLGYFIKEIGTVKDFVVETIPQSPFMSLKTALFDAVSDLNYQNKFPSKETLYEYLKKHYFDIKTPEKKVIHECLSKLIKERRLYHNGRGYFVLRNENVLNEVIATKAGRDFRRPSPLNSNIDWCHSVSNSPSQTDHIKEHRLSDKREVIGASICECSKVNIDDVFCISKSTEASSSSSNGVMKFLKRHGKKQKRIEPAEENNNKVPCDCVKPYDVQYVTESCVRRPTIQRRNSFNGTDSERSYKKEVSFALVGLPSKDAVKQEKKFFARSLSFGAGSMKRRHRPAVKVSGNTEEATELPEQVNHLCHQPDMMPISPNNTLIENYNDLGSALSISKEPACFVEDYCPPPKEVCLAEEISRAYRESSKDVTENTLNIASPRLRRKSGGMPYQSQYGDESGHLLKCRDGSEDEQSFNKRKHHARSHSLDRSLKLEENKINFDKMTAIDRAAEEVKNKKETSLTRPTLTIMGIV